MKCTTCQDEIDLLSAVAHSTRSWPQLQTFLYICPKCSASLYLRVEPDTVHLLRPDALLGPHKWTYTASEPCPRLKVRPEARGLRIQIGRATYLIPSR